MQITSHALSLLTRESLKIAPPAFIYPNRLHVLLAIHAQSYPTLEHAYPEAFEEFKSLVSSSIQSLTALQLTIFKVSACTVQNDFTWFASLSRPIAAYAEACLPRSFRGIRLFGVFQHPITSQTPLGCILIFPPPTSI
jgi:hypothetical protein